MTAPRILTTITLFFGTLFIGLYAFAWSNKMRKGFLSPSFTVEIIIFAVMILVCLATRRYIKTGNGYYIIPFTLSSLFIVWECVQRA